MNTASKATRIDLIDFKTPPMRAFHVTWIAFFVSFFGWFGLAPILALAREDLGLTKEQVGNTLIASVAATVFVRLVVGPLCDRVGPRKVYTWLLLLGSIPVAAVGLSSSYETFLLFRLAIGAIGASFVVTQYHTSLMFAPNCVGTANATTAGWGNAGGGAAQMVMPLLVAGLAALGLSESLSWRLSMAVPGIALFLCGLAYYFLTQDTPEGNFSELRAAGKLPPPSKTGTFGMAAKDARAWGLFFLYGACFGVELTVHNVAPLYFRDRFGLDLKTAGLLAGVFGIQALFARPLGGWIGDKAGNRWGLQGRALYLGFMVLLEGIALVIFSRMPSAALAAASMIVFGLFVHMAAGATYAVVPFINKKATGSVAGIVGAGGNAGAVLAGLFFRSESLSTEAGLLWLGILVAAVSAACFSFYLAPRDEGEVVELPQREAALPQAVAG
ncbi:MAG: MFS transporter [Bdellovibrionota bacterium]